jgi:hypothetical protein
MIFAMRHADMSPSARHFSLPPLLRYFSVFRPDDIDYFELLSPLR